MFVIGTQIHSAWGGYYDYNYWDQNAIIGQHPYHTNVLFATGFSGHGERLYCPSILTTCIKSKYFLRLGLQQAPAVGRAIMELMMDYDYQTLDLTRLQFDRILDDVKAEELGIV